MNVPRRLAAIAALALLPACGERSEAGRPDLAATEIRVGAVSADAPIEDPLSDVWAAAPAVRVALLPQDVAAPRLTEVGVEEMSVQGLQAGARVAFRLVWADETVDDLVDVRRATDAVAIQLPAAPLGDVPPDAMMGEAGRPVAIALWRALWQRRADGGTVGVDALYPNRTSDHYPPQAASDPDDRAVLERLYAPPRAVSNPVSTASEDPEGARTVEDLVAEGFGTLAPARSRSGGRGVHRDGRWHVVIWRPLDVDPDPPTALRPGVSTHLAVAVWDGEWMHRGSRKMRSVWVPLVLAEGTP